MRKGRKVSGGKYKKFRKKKLHETAGQPRTVKLGKEKRKTIRVRGGNEKVVVLSTEFANVIDRKTGICKRVRIKNVAETPANRFLARQNVLTKGAIIDTELGRAEITNRPSQEGSVQAVLIEDKS